MNNQNSQNSQNQQIKMIGLIKNITSLKELVSWDKEFRRYANRITKDKSYADDLVNDMYLKLYSAFENNKVIDGGYVIVTMWNLYRNHIKTENRFDKGTEIYQSIIPEYTDNVDETIETKERIEELYSEIEKRIEKLTWFEKKIFEINQTKSILQLSKDSKISYKALIYSKQKINNKLGITKNKK